MGTMKRYDQYLHDWVPVDQLTVFIEGGDPPIVPKWSPNPEWEDISDCPIGCVQFLVNDDDMCNVVVYTSVNAGGSGSIIDWGDGATTNCPTSGLYSHKYVEGGGKPCPSELITTYKIRVSPLSGASLMQVYMGIDYAIDSASITNSGQLIGAYYNSDSIILPIGAVASTRSTHFYNLKFIIVKKISALVTSETTWSGWPNLEYADVTGYSVVTGSGFASMFNQCLKLRFVDLNFPLITHCSMFYGCSSLEEVDLSSLVNCINMYRAVQACIKLKKVTFPKANKVTNIESMCYSTNTIKEIDITNIGPVTNALNAFGYTFALEKLIFTTELNLVTSLANCFIESGLRELTFGDCPNLTSIGYMCQGAKRFRKLVMGDCPNLTAIAYAVISTSIEYISISNCPKVNNIQAMAAYAPRLKYLNLGNIGAFGSAVTCGALFIAHNKNLEVIDLSNCKLLGFQSIGWSGYKQTLRNFLFHSASTFSSGIAIQHSSFTAADLNDLFSRLPVVSSKTIAIRGNPGTDTCDKTIATLKGWIVNTTSDI